MIQPNPTRHRPGEIRDTIIRFLQARASEATIDEIWQGVVTMLGVAVPSSSIRSYLRLNTPGSFERTARGMYRINSTSSSLPLFRDKRQSPAPVFHFGRSVLYHADCVEWLTRRPSNSIHAIVTDPPYGLLEYSAEQQSKLRSGQGGVWRIPPSFDGHQRSPLPRFTVLEQSHLEAMRRFFRQWGELCLRVLVPGAHVMVASNPLVSYIVSSALAEAGLERRGEIIRLVMTMRGGDRPKNAHEQFSDVSVMPRSMWEPWLLFRKPIQGRVQDNLSKWHTGGLRRPCADRPFGDVIKSAPTHSSERKLAPHPSLKPQAFLRQLVRAALPLGKGIVVDTFAGSGSTLAAAEAVGYESIGIEKDRDYANLAKTAIPKLSAWGANHASIR